jgi:hypothetical protein
VVECPAHPAASTTVVILKMNVAATALTDLHERAKAAEGQLLRTAINATSTTEAGIALGLLGDLLPRRTLIAALNMREILRELPTAPFIMSLDFETLSRVSKLERRGYSWVKRLGRGKRAPEIELLGQGNLCYDIVVRVGKATSLLKPGPVDGEYVRPAALDLLLANEDLLREVIELTTDMGIVHNPRFYLSVEDWQMEHAAESMAGLDELF